MIAVPFRLAAQEREQLGLGSGGAEHGLAEGGDRGLIEAGQAEEGGSGESAGEVGVRVFADAGDEQER